MASSIHSDRVAYPDEKRIALRMPGELHDRLVRLASAEERSLNGQIIYLLRLAAWLVENLTRIEVDAPTDEPPEKS